MRPSYNKTAVELALGQHNRDCDLVFHISEDNPRLRSARLSLASRALYSADYQIMFSFQFRSRLGERSASLFSLASDKNLFSATYDGPFCLSPRCVGIL